MTDRNNEVLGEIRAWHRAVRASPADRAGLRRAQGALDFALVPAFHKLRSTLHSAGVHLKPEAIAQIAQVLVLIEADSTVPLGRTLREGDVSEARVRRLVHAQDREELCGQLASLARRLPAMNTVETVETFAYWGERRAAQIASDYFSKEREDSHADV